MRIRRASVGKSSLPWDHVAVAWVSAWTDRAASNEDLLHRTAPIESGALDSSEIDAINGFLWVGVGGRQGVGVDFSAGVGPGLNSRNTTGGGRRWCTSCANTFGGWKKNSYANEHGSHNYGRDWGDGLMVGHDPVTDEPSQEF